MAVAGVDACRGSWIGVVLSDSGGFAGIVVARFVRDLVGRLADIAGPVHCLAVDIPIGLPEAGSRRAEPVVRALLGVRRSSVFGVPVRAAALEPDYDKANALQRRLAGTGLSRQGHGLRERILDVDGWLAEAPMPVLEVHPELSFATMAGRPMAEPKKTWAGFHARRHELARHGIRLPDDLGRDGARLGLDDVLDAAAVAWTAQRHLHRAAVPHPDPPELGPDGREMAIWA